MGRKTKQRKPEPFKCCETCANMQPIGEGDHICDACCSHDGSPCALILKDFNPVIFDRVHQPLPSPEGVRPWKTST